ncbi:hypothetical protein AX17_005311 [Amanita inopinata Kibby_2008]|nr:hypothetical protein AX17_005311 [Amanita inopinata Kibby_2008]
MMSHTRCSNPMFTAEELVHQLRTAKATVIVTHSTAFETVKSAASITGLASHRVILLDQPAGQYRTIENVCNLIKKGSKTKVQDVGTALGSGEGKRRIALLAWSSGTTGKPKAVAITHYALIANIIQMAVHNRISKTHHCSGTNTFRPGDVALGVLPFFHVAGLIISLHLFLFAGLSVVVAPKYDFQDMIDTIIRYRISHLVLVPPQAIAMSKHPTIRDIDLNFIKYMLIGAAPLPRGVQERLRDLFPRAQIGQAYGLSEMTSSLAMVAGDQKTGPLGSGGRLLPGIEVRVIKRDGTIAGPGESGELVVRGPSASLGYFNNEEASKETFVNGWVRTGDEVMLSNDQEVLVLDRIKEMIKVRGFQVAPAELEGCILEHPDVAEACVIGVQDDYSGEVPLAYVVLTREAREKANISALTEREIVQSIIQHVSDRKVGYKQLRGGIQITDTIPVKKWQWEIT